MGWLVGFLHGDFLQGEGDTSEENVSLGEFELHNIQPGERGGPRIEVAFSIDTSGIVTVTAEDARTGVSDQIEIESPIGMTQQEITDMKSSINTLSAPDTDLSDDVSIHISGLEAKLLTKGDTLDPAIRESAEKTIELAKLALGSDDSDEQKAAIDALKEHASLFPA